MNLFETLKEFKKIEPNQAFKETSKRAILATMPQEAWSLKRTLIAVIETGIAVGLAGFFILLATGQFFGVDMPYGVASPVQFSVINPATLRAEAKAIDMQIQLAQLSYQETAQELATTTTSESTSPTVQAMSAKLAPLVIPTATSSNGAITQSGASPTSTTSSTLSVDQALQQLSQ